MPLSNLAPPNPTREDEARADVTSDTGPRLPPDRLGSRLLWALLASVLVNAALWRFVSQVVHNHLPAPPRPLTFRLITLPRPPHKPKPRRKIVHKVVPPKPKPRPIIKPKPTVKPKPIVKPKPVLRHTVVTPRPLVRPRPAPPAAHHHVITAKGPAPAHHTAQAGGHAQLGKPIGHQNAGQGTDNNQAPPPQPQQQPTPQPQPTPPQPPAPQPQPRPQPPPQPRPQPPPQPTGPTQDATPSNQVYPDIPDELKTGDYKSSVRVKVEIAADGSFSVTLLTSSGDTDIDRRVLDALKRWKWKPALQDGQPVASTQRFRFDFEVQ